MTVIIVKGKKLDVEKVEDGYLTLVGGNGFAVGGQTEIDAKAALDAATKPLTTAVKKVVKKVTAK